MDKRITILLGPDQSGKSYLAGLVKRDSDTVYLNGRDRKLFKNPFLFDQQTESINVIIIDDLEANRIYDAIEYFLDDKLNVHRRRKEPLLIEMPRVIITCNNSECPDLADQLLQGPASIVRRVMIIEVNRKEASNG